MSLLCATLPLPSPPVPLCELVACTRCTSVACFSSHVARGQWLPFCASLCPVTTLEFSPPFLAACDRSACMPPGVASDHLTPPPPVYTSVESLITLPSTVLVMTLNSPALGRRQQHPGASAAATLILSALRW